MVGEGLLHNKPVQGLRLTKLYHRIYAEPAKNRLKSLLAGSFFWGGGGDLDDWEVITGCRQNRTSVPQPIEASVYFWLVRHKSSDIILSYRTSDIRRMEL